jgi:hypothetical protein
MQQRAILIMSFMGFSTQEDKSKTYVYLKANVFMLFYLVSSSSTFVGVFLGISNLRTLSSIFASIFDGTISSGIGIRLLKDLYERSLYT